MPPVIAADRIEKRYGPRAAISGLSFAIAPGEIVGLLGPNGSGKSSLLRILAGYLAPSAGTATVAGCDVVRDSLAMRGRIGYVPEDAPLYDGMRVAEFLRFMAVIKGVSRSGVEAAVDRAAASLQLGRVLRVPIGKLSRGYRQRVAIAQALLNDPAVLLLDEPTNALDAYQVIAIRELVRSFAGKRTVLVASHVLSEIEKMADRVMIMLEGELLTENAAAAATRQRRYRLRVGGSPAAVLAAIGAVPSVTAASLLAEEPRAPAYLVETAAEPGVAGALVAALVAAGLAFEELSELRPDLEQVFLDLTRSRRLEAAA